MKQPVIDYRDFRLSRINEPAFSHLKLLIAWPIYFAAYFLTENLIPAESCHVIWCPLDDMIPFCEVFLIPYVGWYFLIAGSLLYFMLYNPSNFRNMMRYIIITQIFAVAIYVIYPSRQDLRPEVFPRDNILTHVAYSLGIASTWMREKSVGPMVKVLIWLFAILVCLSTMFIKQHSAVDFFAALPICLLAEYWVFHRKGTQKYETQNR